MLPFKCPVSKEDPTEIRESEEIKESQDLHSGCGKQLLAGRALRRVLVTQIQVIPKQSSRSFLSSKNQDAFLKKQWHNPSTYWCVSQRNTCSHAQEHMPALLVRVIRLESTRPQKKNDYKNSKQYTYTVEHCITVKRSEPSWHQWERSQENTVQEQKASCSMMCISFVWKVHTCVRA